MTVLNKRGPIREKIIFITPDGEEFILMSGNKKNIYSTEGWGLPRGTVHTTRGPFQQGETPVAIRMNTRQITMTYNHRGCDREDYWSNRSELVDALRLSRTDMNYPEPGSLRRYLPNGDIRQLDVYIQSGPLFVDVAPRGGNFDIAEELVFTAFDPIIYDPTEMVSSTTGWACVPEDELALPMGFPIGFDLALCNVTQIVTITYTGTWETFPVIEVTGPANDFSITHNQTGALLSLDYNIAAGEVVTFDLSFGAKTIQNNAGTSLLGYLTNDSDLGLFSIQPNPIVAGGVNTFNTSINNGAGATSVQITYYERFAGI